MTETAQTKQELTKLRGSIKSKITSFNNHIQKIIKQESLCEADLINLEERISRAVQAFTEFDTVQTKLEFLTEDAELDEQYSARAIFEDSYYEAVATAKNIVLVNRKSVNDKAESIHSSAGLSNMSEASGGETRMHGIRLPVIQLSIFDGDLDKWLEFRDTFESLIHQSVALQDIQKYHYLRSSLKGEAAQVVQSIELSAENYSIAWETLCDRYNNTSLLVHNHTKALFNIEQVQKESYSRIRFLIDSVSKHLKSLQQLQQPTEQWDTLVIYLVTSKLDGVTNRAWEQKKSSDTLPTWDELKQFLKDRANMLETLAAQNNEKSFSTRKEQSTSHKSRSFHTINKKCSFCKNDHTIYACDEFLKLPVGDRIKFVYEGKMCSNCLREGHFSKTCHSGSCKYCHKKHNSLLHLENKHTGNAMNSAENAKTGNTATGQSSNNNVALTAATTAADQVLLSTILMTVVDKHGREHSVRGLLDSGSQSCFMSKKLADILDLNRVSTNLTICGLNNASCDIQYKSNVLVKSQQSNFEANISCIIVPQITSNLPNFLVNKQALHLPKNIRLADASFNLPGPIDILLGADIFWKTICVGKIDLGRGKPVLQKTRFGWIISGQIGFSKSNSVNCHFTKSSVMDIDSQLSKFWALEECSINKSLSSEEKTCEQHFVENTLRSTDGRFIVSLPLKKPPESLGESRDLAMKRFYSIERKLQTNSNFRKQYTEFMTEYEELGHMTQVNPDQQSSNNPNYYMPHLGVVRDSLTTSLRVVFDASASTSNGISLNEIQLTGPTIQNDLLSIIMQFRLHTYVVSADIAKMYRQVLVNENQRSLQRILWRASPSEPINTYELNTVTYGQAAAPFLAIRCLFELADQCEADSPEAAHIIKHNFYVDDLLFSADSVEKASFICEEVDHVLKRGKFQLRKWFSNNPEVLKNVSTSEISHGILNFGNEQGTKTLGLAWNRNQDSLMFQIDISSDNVANTKRGILSHIAKIYDPLGILAPCTIIAKLTIQKLWILKLSWDEPLPPDVHKSWLNFKNQLPHLNSLSIPRQVLCKSPIHIEAHCFSDSSNVAYAGCLFLKSMDEQENVSVNLLCAKSKVAPIKTQTIPRLELCGALVLAKLVNRVINSLNLPLNRVVLWTDSTIVLGWIRTSPHLLKTFVGNRVSEIQQLTECYEWRHVPGKLNPADLVTRGICPDQIESQDMWWHGPEFLRLNESSWPTLSENIADVELPDMRKRDLINLIATSADIFPFEKYSSFSKLNRVVAYLLRFKNNCLKPESKINGPLTKLETESALLLLVGLSQRESFPQEFISLTKNSVVSTKSRIYSLNPFLDHSNIIRVGGRLRNSNFEFDKKHPMLLDSKHKLTKLLVSHEHLRLLHAGPQSLLASIREKFWPISGRNIAKATVRKCITCFRYNPKITNPIMGDLPHSRLTVSSPFHNTGVDYAGPFFIRSGKGRGAKNTKCYVCLYVCFATKAIHLELVTDLTSDAFVLSLRRFSSRRGKPACIYSDNGSNFVKADKDLKELYAYLSSHQEVLQNSILQEGIEWKFIPVNSPHFGGLWESNVKITKYHLKRVMGKANLTFEEFYSLLTQIEAVLNSRPLCPLSTDPNDLTPLTPAHFLIGKTLTSIPDPSVAHIPENRLSQFQRIQSLQQHFWTRWSKEFISELQQRQKWKTTGSQLQEGALVLIKDDHLPTLYWRLGRVVKLYPGKDNVNRVADVKCADGLIKRGFAKICPLPVD